MSSKKAVKQKKNNVSLSFKKFLLISVTVLLIISPLILAVINIVRNEQLQKDNSLSVTLYDNNSIELASEAGMPENANDGSLTRIFYELINAPQSPAEFPETLDKNIFIKASIILSSRTFWWTATIVRYWSFIFNRCDF